jgi:hypothetical protein
MQYQRDLPQLPYFHSQEALPIDATLLLALIAGVLTPDRSSGSVSLTFLRQPPKIGSRRVKNDRIATRWDRADLM